MMGIVAGVSLVVSRGPWSTGPLPVRHSGGWECRDSVPGRCRAGRLRHGQTRQAIEIGGSGDRRRNRQSGPVVGTRGARAISGTAAGCCHSWHRLRLLRRRVRALPRLGQGARGYWYEHGDQPWSADELCMGQHSYDATGTRTRRLSHVSTSSLSVAGLDLERPRQGLLDRVGVHRPVHVRRRIARGLRRGRSGPVGWRQLLLAIVADNSLLVPVLKPALPHIWPSLSPPNHAGTFTYDLRREVRGILRAGGHDRRTLVAAHINYAHHPAYPSSRDLSWSELWRVARAPAATIRDRSFNWQDRDEPSDPVQLHPWKLKHLHEVIASEVDAARYLEDGRRLVVFSDHGDRAGLGVANFAERRYYHVPLATFGLAARCPREPISLIDIGSLLGLSEVHADAVGGVHHCAAGAMGDAGQNRAPALVRRGRADRSLLADVFKGLRRYDPAGSVERPDMSQRPRRADDRDRIERPFEERRGIGR